MLPIHAEGLPASLIAQKELLLHRAQRMLIGPDARAWPAAAHTACALAVCLCGAARRAACMHLFTYTFLMLGVLACTHDPFPMGQREGDLLRVVPHISYIRCTAG